MSAHRRNELLATASYGRVLHAGILAGAMLWAAAGTAWSAEPTSRAQRPSPTAVDTEDAPELRRLPESARAERRLQQNPQDRDARLQAAQAHLLEGIESPSKLRSAREHASAVLEQHPNDVEALILLGQASLLQEDVANAARYYRLATFADGNSATAYLGLGDALSRLGDEASANAAFDRFRELEGLPPLERKADTEE